MARLTLVRKQLGQARLSTSTIHEYRDWILTELDEQQREELRSAGIRTYGLTLRPRVRIREGEFDAADPQWLTEKYLDELTDREAAEKLFPPDVLRGNTVTLNCRTPYFLGPDSSPINRFIVAHLKAVDAFNLVVGEIDDDGVQPPSNCSEPWNVTIRGDYATEEATYQGVVLRHGPRPPALGRLLRRSSEGRGLRCPPPDRGVLPAKTGATLRKNRRGFSRPSGWPSRFPATAGPGP